MSRIRSVTTLLLRALPAAAVFLLLPAAAPAEEVVVDPMSAATRWVLTGQRVSYVLGKTALEGAREPAREGAPGVLKFTYDLDRRYWVGIQWRGEPLAGRPEALSLWVHGDGSRHRLAARMEDARGCAFDVRLGALDWEGWRQLSVPMDEAQWTPVRRHGEEARPARWPVALREIRLMKSSPQPLLGTLAFSDLRARTPVAPLDRVRVSLATDAPANVFYLPEPVRLKATLTNPTDKSYRGELETVLVDWLGQEQRFAGGPLSLAAGATLEREVNVPVAALGAYEGWVRFVVGDAVREGRRRFAVSRRMAAAPTDPGSPFGMGLYLPRFGTDAELRQAITLAREAGVKWTRDGLQPAALQPNQGQWAWEGPKWARGPQGGSVELAGGRSLSVASSPSLNRPCQTGEVTFSFRMQFLRLDYTDRWRTLLGKGEGPQRQWMFFLTVPTRQLSVSFGDGATSWTDLACTKDDWKVGQWYHVVMAHRREDRGVRWWVDGAPAGTAEARFPETLAANDLPMEIGRHLNVALDDLAIYDRALVPAELDAAKPVAHWAFDEGQGPRAADAGGNGNHADEVPLRQDSIFAQSAAAGLSTYCILMGTPGWMASRPPQGIDRPGGIMPRTEEWSAAVEKIVARYKEKGIRVWEIWNEPNIEPFWSPKPDPDEYYRVLAASYRAIKKVDPGATVLGCSLAGPHGPSHRPPYEFVEEVLKRGGGQVMDALSIHPYRQPRSPEDSEYVADLKAMSDLTAKYGRRLPLWITEVGWPNDTGGSGEGWATRMLPRAYLLALANGVRNVAWYDYHDDGQDPSYLEHNCGLLLYDLTPKPLYFAYRTMATELAGLSFEREVPAGPGATVLLFSGGGRRVAVAWSHRGEVPVALQAGANAVALDLMGNPEVVSTRDGALLLRLREDAVFLRGVPASLAAIRPVRADPPVLKLAQGEAGRLRVTLRNPFRGPVTLAAAGRSVTLRPGEERVVDLPVPAGAAAAWKPPVWRTPDGTVSWETPARVVALAGRRAPIFEWRGETSEMVTVPHTPQLDATDEVTVWCTLRSDGPTDGWPTPVAKFEGDVLRNYGLFLGREKGEFSFSASFEKGAYRHSDFSSGVSLFDGKWHTVAATYSRHDAEVRLYVDGNLAQRHAYDGGALKPTTASLTIAGSLFAGQTPRGAVREVRIWNRALTADELK